MKCVKQLLLLCVGIVAVARVHPAAAQQPRLSPASIGQIADAVLGEIIPPDSSLSRVPVSRRTIIFDQDRMMARFANVSRPGVSVSDLELRASVSPGTKAVLEDCAQEAKAACAGLGWRVYAWIEPLSVADSEVLVRGHFLWADRGATVYQRGVAPGGRARLVGMDADVYVTRGNDGVWRFSRGGTTYAGD